LFKNPAVYSGLSQLRADDPVPSEIVVSKST